MKWIDIHNGVKLEDKDGSICTVVGTTTNSVNVWMPKKSERGIDCTNWFAFDKFFIERFKISHP